MTTSCLGNYHHFWHGVRGPLSCLIVGVKQFAPLIDDEKENMHTQLSWDNNIIHTHTHMHGRTHAHTHTDASLYDRPQGAIAINN